MLFNKHITSHINVQCHAPIPHVTTKTYALVRSRLSRAAEKPQQNSQDVKNMTDNATDQSAARFGVATRKKVPIFRPIREREGAWTSSTVRAVFTSVNIYGTAGKKGRGQDTEAEIRASHETVKVCPFCRISQLGYGCVLVFYCLR